MTSPCATPGPNESICIRYVNTPCFKFTLKEHQANCSTNWLKWHCFNLRCHNCWGGGPSTFSEEVRQRKIPRVFYNNGSVSCLTGLNRIEVWLTKAANQADSHWFRYSIVACLAPSHYLNQFCLNVLTDFFPDHNAVTSDKPVAFKPTYNCITLTHWGRVAHICVRNLTIIVSDNGLSPSHYLNQYWNIVNWTLGNKLAKS